MKSALRDAGLAESMLDTLSPETIREHLAAMTGKAERNAARRYADAEAQRDAVGAALKVATGSKCAADLFDGQPKEYQRMLQDLLSNSISDYHFVERSEPVEDCHGYVALLREIRYLPVTLADELRDGIDFQRFAELCRDQPRFADKLAIADEEQYAMAVGVVQSPFIELLMQRFTNLYARIGVTDFSHDLMKSLRAIVPFNLGAAS